MYLCWMNSCACQHNKIAISLPQRLLSLYQQYGVSLLFHFMKFRCLLLNHFTLRIKQCGIQNSQKFNLWSLSYPHILFMYSSYVSHCFVFCLFTDPVVHPVRASSLFSLLKTNSRCTGSWTGKHHFLTWYWLAPWLVFSLIYLCVILTVWIFRIQSKLTRTLRQSAAQPWQKLLSYWSRACEKMEIFPRGLRTNARANSRGTWLNWTKIWTMTSKTKWRRSSSIWVWKIRCLSTYCSELFSIDGRVFVFYVPSM